MKIKVNKHKLNIHYRGSPWGSRTQQHAYCLRYAHSQHIESHLGKKQPQAKIPIAFLFSQLHFDNVTSHALFYGGHLVMRSKRCAVQNQGITLRDISNSVILLDFGKGKNITCLLITCYSYWGMLALSRGITDLAALGSYCHDWGPIFPSTARASSVSKLFIIWHSASDSKMHFRWLPWRILHNASNSDKSKLPRVRKTNSLIVKSS